MPASKNWVVVPRCEVVQVKSFKAPFTGLEFGAARFGFSASSTS